ncbi:MAG: acyl dehydratase [Archangiaceae bacterium]|nr:acyl dehydratase [Archangiaceae bacterium]
MSTPEPLLQGLERVGGTLPAALPALTFRPTHAQVFMFSAATWNRHHIHYSDEAARAEGHTGVVVQRGLIGNFLARMLTRWLEGRGEIRGLSWKVVKSARPGDELSCRGELTSMVVRDQARLYVCALRVVDSRDLLLAEGTAELELD